VALFYPFRHLGYALSRCHIHPGIQLGDPETSPATVLFSFLYNVMLLMNSWSSISIALIFGEVLFRHYYASLSKV